MIGNLRLIYEGTPAAGGDPEDQIDTDELDPPVYEDVVVTSEIRRQIASGATDVAVAIPDSCFLLILSDVEVLLRLNTGETQMRVRTFEAGGDDSEAVAVPARTLLFSGNGVSVANIRVLYLGTVT